MPEQESKSKQDPKPSPVNGPAFFVFGILFLALGIGTEMRVLILPALVTLPIGILGIYLQRRYDKAMGIEETLPGKSPERPESKL